MSNVVHYIVVAVLVPLAFVLAACSGTRTFHDYARAGDTVAVAAGWKHHYQRDNITVTITPSSGPPAVYPANDQRIRAVINLYPDPVSSIIVSRETDQDMTRYASSYANTTGAFTYGDKDWWQTVVFIDLPEIPTGLATVEITNPQGEAAVSQLNIIEGAGQANTFSAETLGGLTQDQLESLKRIEHHTVDFIGTSIPYAIQVELTHDPDRDHGGYGRVDVVNPLGYIKNIAWSDDGANTTRVIITPAREGSITDLLDFKFYVTGGIQNLMVSTVQAYDADGNIIPQDEVTATVHYYE